MAINNARMQQIRGPYADFDKSKALPGEIQVVIQNDPSVPSGKAVYIAFAAGDVRRLVSIEDIEAMEEAGRFKGEKGDQGIQGIQGIQGPQGPVGPKGDAFVYSDFTPAQLAALKGQKGNDGPQGPKGDKGDTGGVAYATFDVVDGCLVVNNTPSVTLTNFWITDGDLFLEVTG